MKKLTILGMFFALLAGCSTQTADRDTTLKTVKKFKKIDTHIKRIGEKKNPATPVEGFSGFDGVLPAEAIDSIFRYVSSRDISTLREVDKQFNKIASDNTFINKFITDSSIERTQRVKNALKLPKPLFDTWFKGRVATVIIPEMIKIIDTFPETSLLRKKALRVTTEQLSISQKAQAFSQAIADRKPERALYFLNMGVQPSNQDYKALSAIYKSHYDAMTRDRVAKSMDTLRGIKTADIALKHCGKNQIYCDLLTTLIKNPTVPKKYEKDIASFQKMSKSAKKTFEKLTKK